MSSRNPLLYLALLVFALHSLVTGGHLQSPDEELMFRMADGMAFRGTTQVTPLEADLATGLLPPGIPAGATFATKQGLEPGTFYAQYLILQPLIAVPFLWMSALLEPLFARGFASIMWPNMGISSLLTLPQEQYESAIFRRGFLVTVFNPLIAAMSAVALARLAMLLTGNRRASIITAAVWAFGTVAWPHSRTFFTESLAALLALLAFDQIVRSYVMPGRLGFRAPVLLGTLLALAHWQRVDAPILSVGLLAAFAGLAVIKHVRNNTFAEDHGPFPWREVATPFAFAAASMLALQLFNMARWGWDPTHGYGDQKESVAFSTPILIGLHGLLMSPGKGLFFFSPVLLLAVWGWCVVPRRLRWLPWAAAVAFTPFFIAMAKWQNWDGGWCWGPRHIVQLHLPAMLGAAFFFAGSLTLWRRAIVWVLMPVAVFVQILGSSQSSLEYYHEYFRTVEDGEYHRVNVRDLQAGSFTRSFDLRVRNSDGSVGRVARPDDLPAPMIDSLYIPQHTQFMTYGRMWRLGYCDLYIVNLLLGNRNPDRWTSTP